MKSPIKFDTPLQKEAYKILQKLDIDFECVDTDEAITMEDCVQINKKLNMKMVI
ncbi:TPA: proline--tRNA ligase [Clostridioides difficile]|nr:proline--tRNA ligase [Clostridioides difficile]